MNFQIGGRPFEIVPEDVLHATRNTAPNAVDGRNKYFVNLHGRQYPIKQAVRLTTGLASPEFTAQYAYRILAALGFEISERSPSLTAIQDAPGDDPLTLLVVFETDEDGWEVASCPTLPGCHSQGRTKEEALANIREAIRGYLASMREHGDRAPSSSRFELLELSV